ncbi:MAG: hypothetical protein V7693_10115 [Halopseudomonas sabulinigri]
MASATVFLVRALVEMELDLPLTQCMHFLVLSRLRVRYSAAGGFWKAGFHPGQRRMHALSCGAGLRGKQFFTGVLVCVVAVGTYMASATVFLVRALFEMELNLP